MAEKQEDIIQEVTNEEYKWGFVTDIDTDTIGKGLNEDVIRLISRKKEVCPVGFLHRLPPAECLQTEVQHPLRLLLFP